MAWYKDTHTHTDTYILCIPKNRVKEYEESEVDGDLRDSTVIKFLLSVLLSTKKTIF